MTGEMNRRAFLVAGGLTTAATVIGLRAGDGSATMRSGPARALMTC